MSNFFERGLQTWHDQLAGGNNPFASISEERIDEMHALAYQLYSKRYYEDALHLFRTLVMVRPAESKFWKGFGASLQMQKQFAEALNCYANSQRINRESPDPFLYVYAADCYFALKQIHDGLKALEAAELCASKKGSEAIRAHVAFMKEQWI